MPRVGSLVQVWARMFVFKMYFLILALCVLEWVDDQGLMVRG